MKDWNSQHISSFEITPYGYSVVGVCPNCGQHSLKNLAEKYEYQVVTFRLIGDLEVLFKRSQKRDLDPKRHLSHLVSRYHKGDVLEDRSKADCLVTYDIFMDRCKNRGYGTFELGHLIEVDVTDFSKIDYPALIKELCDLVEE